MAGPNQKTEAQRFDFKKDIERMQKMLEILRLQYNLFFAGARREPPSRERMELDRLFQYYRNATLTNLEQQFRFNSFANGYTLQCEQWGKWQRAKDDGIVADPRMIAALRKAEKELGELERETPEEAKQRHSMAAKQEEPKAQKQAQAKPEGRPERSPMQQLFEQYSKARLENGEMTAIDLAAFEQQVAKQRQAIIEKYKAKDVAFTVAAQNGKVTLKAKIIGKEK